MGLFGLFKKNNSPSPEKLITATMKCNLEMEYMNFYLGVKNLQDAQTATDELPSSIHVQIRDKGRINMVVGPAAADNDMEKGVMLYLGGNFTQEEMSEIYNLGKYADKSVTDLVVTFVAKQAVNMHNQGLSSPHTILGQEDK
jgi:hypothetical protein